VLTTLIGRGRIASDVLGLLTSTPGQELHTREIARRVKADAHPVQRALEQLVAAGLVQSRRLGNLRLWSVREESALMPAVRDIVRRTGGIAERLRRRLRAMHEVHLAFLFGSYASGRDVLGSDIDLFIVGTVEWEALSNELRTLSAELGREVNPIVWTVEELVKPTKKEATFLRDVLGKPKIWLMGDDSELERVRFEVGAKVGRSTSGQARARRRGGGAVPRPVVGAQPRARAT
jgi:predicted nucleotidyltransferase